MKNEQRGHRKGSWARKTKETALEVKLDLDGRGRAEVETGLPFFDHLLENLFLFSLFDATLKARGDLEVGPHHTIEDTGLALGGAFSAALAGREGVDRLGFCYVPFDDALVRVCLDLSGRPFFHFSCLRELNFEVRDFLRALTSQARFTLSVDILRGENEHHILEAVFKGLGCSLRQAVRRPPRRKGVLSVK